jgi:hypothetical protein
MLTIDDYKIKRMNVIAVKENSNTMRNNLSDLPFKHGKYYEVSNYFEAVGVMAAIKAGISLDTVTRPIELTEVIDFDN